MPADPQEAYAQLIGRLTGPGGPHELARENVLGAPMTVFKNRIGSLAQMLVDSERHGDAEYMVTEDQRITFARHARDVRSIAKVFADEYGIGKGDRVAILGANSPEWVEAFWATQLLGAIAVGFNAWWAPMEVTNGLELSEPKLLLVDTKRASLLGEVDVPLLSLEDDVPRLAAAHPEAVAPSVEIDEDDPAIILFTSGTSGKPKGAVHSNRNAIAVTGFHVFNDSILEAFAGDDADADHVYLVTSPMFHIASLHNIVVPRLATGTKMVIYQGKFDANRVLSLIEKEKITNWGAVPTMAKRLISDGDFDAYDTSSLKAFALASAPSSPSFQQQLRERVPFAQNSLVNSYGLTESCGGIAVATPPDLSAHPTTVGRPTLTVEMEIRDAFNEKVEDGVEGEVCARAPYIMIGYWNNDEANASAFDQDRWLHTGDIGMMKDGMLFLTSRRSDLIVRGGENIYPTEVEQCLDDYPGVRECVVLGAPDDDFGQVPVAIVVTEPGADVTREGLEGWVSERLAYFKRPVRWRITENPLPRNATGKIVRREIAIPTA
ncbi:class I adenylate-forming enzyme family protein [Tomitella gaofuii]|uniref:class I adenylate-forming enzyme family protein n=1 Tax=Tomitella gaofuii TaxID=2760083 RepID=UPI0015FB7BE5|nr:class I adenylate-forming enzyme family protein [Tomitella gaofuii]